MDSKVLYIHQEDGKGALKEAKNTERLLKRFREIILKTAFNDQNRIKKSKLRILTE